MNGQDNQFEASQGVADGTQLEETLPAREDVIQAAAMGPEEMPDGAPAVNDPDWDQCSPSEQWAIEQYAKHHELAVGNVRFLEVQNSKEGALHYAMMGQDWSARSNLSQCFKRALRHQPADAKIYLDLDERLRKEYRATWGLKRNFQLLGRSLVHLFCAVCLMYTH